MGVLSRFAEGLQKLRQDGWENLVSGLGTSRDKATYTQFLPSAILQPETCAHLYHQDDMCQRVVSLYPKEALRRGWAFTGPTASQTSAEAERLCLIERLQEGATWGRCFGGAVGVLTINDGRKPAEPLDTTRPLKIDSIQIYDRRSVDRVLRFDGETDGPASYGRTRIFRITPPYGGMFEVHRDRLLVFGGPLTGRTEREANAGWDYSALQVLYNVIRSFNSGFLATDTMLQDASTSVMKIKGLLGMISTDRATLETRAQLMDLTRSIARSVLLDADGGEDYSKQATSFTGIPDVLDRLANRLAAATEIPVTVLMGQAPAGLNATGESDVRGWYDRVESYRRTEITPHAIRIFRLQDPAWADRIVWPSFWQTTDKEKAETDKIIAETDDIRIQGQVLMPEEVALARFDPDGPRKVEIDPTLRKRPAAPASAPTKPPA